MIIVARSLEIEEDAMRRGNHSVIVGQFALEHHKPASSDSSHVLHEMTQQLSHFFPGARKLQGGGALH